MIPFSKTKAPRLVLLGNSSVGKSSLVYRMVHNEFKTDIPPTTAVAHVMLTLDPSDPFDVQMWDTAGMERYRSINKIYTRDAVCALLVFDFTQSSSFTSLDTWKSDFISGDPDPDATIILIGNKSDKNDDFEVELNDAKKWADDHNIKFFPVSALDGSGIDELLQELSKCIPRPVDHGEILFEEAEADTTKKQCC
ncbi:Ras-related protein RABA1c [Tritrichomonas foetus]|uniref:Ras-related protein RABA1c n=1 Tax=Tritrichomonas foetus TaxID=1144522 RepID=A0A1J4JPB0_9EUKA|nr:Ras-related protein RABA1c [Tritrichomonas foetus]|eukprot:OHS99357.1 Ras-related protein RABA1c [Tritrichomonas foetus]